MKSRLFGSGLGAGLAAWLMFVLMAACSSNDASPAAGGSDGVGQGGSGAGSGAGTGGQRASGGTGGAGSENVGGSSGLGGAGGGAGGAAGAPSPVIDAAMGGSGAAEAGDGSGGTDAGGWPAVTDPAARGPLPTARDKNVGPGAAYDVFRPATLGAGGRKHPIISWANGTLFALDKYQPLLDHWASHGFVVIAAHTNTTAGGGTHKAGIDWLLAEAAKGTGVFAGMLDPQHIGAAGHSQGGGATIAAGSNKPGVTGITATLPLMPLLSFESDATIVGRQLAPMFNINATMDDRDPTGKIANTIFEGAKGPLVQGAFIGVHEDAMSPAMHGPTLSWFRWKLMGDEQARQRFEPPATCGLCQDPAWKQIRFKNPP
jgi:hypothetical protein